MSLLVALLIVEVALRLGRFSDPDLNQMDRITGFSLRPHASGWCTREGRSFVRINSDGMRDVEHRVKKPTNCIRIAVLGDSYAEARQVALEDSFPKVLEKQLNDRRAAKGSKFEVLNFGVGGFDTARELLTLRQKVWKYEPDYVLLAFFSGNDIRSNARGAIGNCPFRHPFFYYDDHDQLQLNDSFRDDTMWNKRWQREQLGTAFSIKSTAIWHLVQSAREALNRHARSADQPNRLNEAGLNFGIYGEPSAKNWQLAWDITEDLLGLMHREVTQHGAQLLVVTLSNAAQVYPDQRLREEFVTAVDADDLFYPDLRIAACCESKGIPVLTLAPKLLNYAEKHQVFLHGFPNTRMGIGHWNEAGHRVAAELIAEKFQELLSKPPTTNVATSNRLPRR